MPLPNELHMPSLDHLDKNQGTLMLNVMFAGGGPRGDLLRRHFVNLVRLVDLSVVEYELARTCLEESLPGANNRLGAILSAVDHLELCVITLRRALNALDTVARHPEAPGIPRLARRVLQAFDGPLRRTRDTVIHVEEDISKGDISHGQSHSLLVSEDGRTASIGEHQLSLEQLGRAIRRLHEMAESLSQYRESGQEQKNALES